MTHTLTHTHTAYQPTVTAVKMHALFIYLLRKFGRFIFHRISHSEAWLKTLQPDTPKHHADGAATQVPDLISITSLITNLYANMYVGNFREDPGVGGVKPLFL